MTFQRYRDDREYFIPNDQLTLPKIPCSTAPIETLEAFATLYDAAPGTRRYIRGCNAEDWDDSPKSLSHLRSMLYAVFHTISWSPERESKVRRIVQGIRDKVAAQDLE